MRILALDSSGLVASVAVAEDDNLIAEYTVNYKKTHSQTLLPMLQTVKDMIDLDLSTIDAIAIAAGPGSFTGLRIGSATAKGLGLALNKPLIEVPTIAGLAYNLYGTDKLVCPLMDARRNQVYTGIYTFERGQEEGGSTYHLKTLTKQCAVDISEMMEKLNGLGREVIFLGDGVPVYCEQIARSLQVPYSFAPAHCNRQRAAAVAALAKCYYEEGRTVNAKDHQPEYLRLSQAERERLEQEKNNGQ
ncbi:MAG: tRNA (adenosine(37)-N6)-threonylcarbamoyltransferase complex dimerization subunit type 1 TsaB [Lachnospiraceae bacterium]